MFFLLRIFQENIKVEVVEKAAAKSEDKMPLYPHSILKKPKEVSVGVVKAANKEPDVVPREEPVEAEGDVFDRPAAQPGKTSKSLKL